ncbi:MAG TPA: hypothetical protein VI113_05745 [Alphaproteobacteria bacterium]
MSPVETRAVLRATKLVWGRIEPLKGPLRAAASPAGSSAKKAASSGAAPSAVLALKLLNTPFNPPAAAVPLRLRPWRFAKLTNLMLRSRAFAVVASGVMLAPNTGENEVTVPNGARTDRRCVMKRSITGVLGLRCRKGS